MAKSTEEKKGKQEKEAEGWERTGRTKEEFDMRNQAWDEDDDEVVWLGVDPNAPF